MEPYFSFAKHWGTKALKRVDMALANTITFGKKLYYASRRSFSEAMEPAQLDARGVPTAACPKCGEFIFVLYATFDDEYNIKTYMLDSMCAMCGTLLTAPTPLDCVVEEE